MRIIITSISVVMRPAAKGEAPLTDDYACRIECAPAEIPDKLHDWLVHDYKTPEGIAETNINGFSTEVVYA